MRANRTAPRPDTRIQLGAGQVLVTTDALYRRKVRQIRHQMPTLRHVILVPEEGDSTNEPDTLDWGRLMAAATDAIDWPAGNSGCKTIRASRNAA